LPVIRRRTLFQFRGSAFEIFGHVEPSAALIGIPRKLSEGSIPFRQSAQFLGVFHRRDSLLNAKVPLSAVDHFDLNQSFVIVPLSPPAKGILYCAAAQ
jgi:hypothetical protein